MTVINTNYIPSRDDDSSASEKYERFYDAFFDYCGNNEENKKNLALLKNYNEYEKKLVNVGENLTFRNQLKPQISKGSKFNVFNEGNRRYSKF